MRTFWPIYQEQKFSQTWDLCRNTANNISFHYRTNSVKINNQIFQYIQKTLVLAHVWFICPNFGATIFSLLKIRLSCTTAYGFPTPCQNSEKTNDTIPRKCHDRRMGRRIDKPYFIGPFWLLLGVQKVNKHVYVDIFG